MRNKYYNEGWFGKHPIIYEIGSWLIVLLRRKAAKKVGIKNYRILDIATGTGAHALQLAKLGHEVVGIDIDNTMLDKAKNKSKELKLSFLTGDGTKLPFQDNEFDAATISFAMHDVPVDVGIKILNEAKRIIKDNGFICIIDYNQLNTLGAKLLYPIAISYESPNYKPFVKGNFDYYLQKTGLQLVKKNTFLGAVQMIKLERKKCQIQTNNS